MKLSVGGVMLLVRLHADLSKMPPPSLELLGATIKEAVNPEVLLGEGSRLALTYRWLEKQFGRRNAVRAVLETINELALRQAAQ
ncbi:MAG TPA: hypothetical protein VND22_00330 [Actinomycetota bacterium]|nr:hypothetical protein [Actinomycetota bacterium]